MKWMKSIALIGVLLAGGCGGGELATVPMQPLPPVPTPSTPAEPQDNANGIEALAALRKPLKNEFLPADKADQCPMIHVTTPDGREVDMQPGRAGSVTIVVVWGMDSRQGKAAVLHVNDLVNKYFNVGVRAVGIVEKTEGAQNALEFAGGMQIRMPLYYDDLKQRALRALAGEAGASERTAVPAIFLVDRRLRLRFYRPGFRYSMVGMEENGQMVFHFQEDLPEDQTIEHYVGQILGERW